MCQIRHGLEGNEVGMGGWGQRWFSGGCPHFDPKSVCNKPSKWRPANDNKTVWSFISVCRWLVFRHPFRKHLIWCHAPTEFLAQPALPSTFAFPLHFVGPPISTPESPPERSSRSIADVRVAILMQFLCARFRLPIFYLTPFLVPFQYHFFPSSAIYFLSCAIIAVCLSLDCSFVARGNGDQVLHPLERKSGM